MTYLYTEYQQVCYIEARAHEGTVEWFSLRPHSEVYK
jgi:hypothetical protein